MAARDAQHRPTPRGASGVRGGAGKAKTTDARSRLFGRRSSTTGTTAAPAAGPGKPKAPFVVKPAEALRAQRHSAARDEAPRRSAPSLRALAITSVVVVLLGVVFAATVAVLSRTSVFTIESVIATASEHVSEESLVRLAHPEEGATLLNVDVDAIKENVRRNPWVADVHVERVFPSTLRISVTERRVKALVVMGSGDVVWCLGDGNVWIEPIKVNTGEGQDFAEAALAQAQAMGATLIRDIPESVSPEAATEALDETIVAVSTYMSGFSKEFSEQVLSYSAPSTASVSCILASGVVISLGQPNDISTKEEIISQLVSAHEGQITYINVRVPSNPSYRTIDAPNVQAGTGALGESGVDPGAAQESEERAETGLPTEGEGRFQTSTSSSDEDEDYDDSYDEYDDGY